MLRRAADGLLMSYTVRIGSAKLRKPSKDYQALFSLPHHEAEDDGKTILHAGDGLPVCADCKRGHLQWGEGGYVPWHRICDVCGSHWDLHPITWGPRKPTHRLILPSVSSDDRYCIFCDDIVIWCRHYPKVQTSALLPEYSRFVQGQGEIPLDPAELIGDSGRTWGDFLAICTPEIWAAAAEPEAVKRMADSITVSGSWARRARFY